MSATLIIKSQGARSLWRGHPWLYAQTVKRIVGKGRAGQVVRLPEAPPVD